MTEAWSAALRDGDLASLASLADAGANINARDRHNQTSIMLAAPRGQTAVVEFLIRRGADLNHTAKYGLSALMLAVVAGHRDIVRLLVAAGADLSIHGVGAPGFAGKTALDLATARGPDLEALFR